MTFAQDTGSIRACRCQHSAPSARSPVRGGDGGGDGDLRREHPLNERTLVISIALVEPEKATRARRCGRATPSTRTAAIVLVDCVAETSCEATVSLSEDRLLSFETIEGQQAAIIGEEYEACEQLVKAHPDFAAALARRGITDQSLVCVDPDPRRDARPRRAASVGGSAAGSSGCGRRPRAIRTDGRSRASSRSST